MKTLDELREEMSERGLDAYFDALAPLAKNSIRIALDVRADENIPIGVSKFGGCPDLPAGVEWFRTGSGTPMTFLAQINFAETAAYDLDNKLPKNGRLYLFYDCSEDGIPWGFDPEDSDAWNVFFYDGDTALLSRREPPEDLGQDYNGGIFGSARMHFDAAVELPSVNSDLLKIWILPWIASREFGICIGFAHNRVLTPTSCWVMPNPSRTAWSCNANM